MTARGDDAPADARTRTVVIVGASLAGASAAETLRREGFDGRVVLVGAEREPPYERPPLSKGYLIGATPEDKLFLRPPAWYEERGIELRLGVRATGLDARARTVALGAGERLAFDRLLIATGGEPRRLGAPGADLPGVRYLRTLDDARALAADLPRATRVVVVGAGFIGAEVAAACRGLGRDVTMLELLPVPLERALGREVGALYAAAHRARGVDLRMGEGVAALRGAGRVEEVVTTGGARIGCDLVVVGVGVRPSVGWLRGSGVAPGDGPGDGVIVDRFCETGVPGIFAAGDVARWPYEPAGSAPLRVRLEHYDNALRQGEAAARNLLGRADPYAPLPYFWSDQYDLKSQMVGYAPSWDRVVLRGRLDAGALAAFYLEGGRVRAALLVNRVRDLGPARRLVAAGATVDPALLADEAADLRRLLPPARGADH